MANIYPAMLLQSKKIPTVIEFQRLGFCELKEDGGILDYHMIIQRYQVQHIKLNKMYILGLQLHFTAIITLIQYEI